MELELENDQLVVFSLSSTPSLADRRGGEDISGSQMYHEKCTLRIPPLQLPSLTGLGMLI